MKRLITKKAIALVLTLAMLLSLVPAVFAADSTATYTLEPSKSTVAQGEEFTVAVNLTHDFSSTLYEMDTAVTYDHDVLELTSAAIGSAFAGQTMLITNGPARGEDYYILYENNYGNFTVPQGTVAVLTFSVKANAENGATSTIGLEQDTNCWGWFQLDESSELSVTPRVNTATITVGASGASTAQQPTFSPDAGTITDGGSVEISCATEGATIYYTTNGDDPTTSSTQYTGAITVHPPMTIKAIAVKEGYNDSAIASASYTVASGGDAGKISTYAALKAAIDNADGETTIELGGNITVDQGTNLEIASGKDITILGNGTGDGNYTLTLNGGYVNVSGTLTLKDIKLTGSDAAQLVRVMNGGSLKIDNAALDGTFSQCVILSGYGSTTTVYSATIGDANGGYDGSISPSGVTINFCPTGTVDVQGKITGAFTVTQQEGYPISALTVSGAAAVLTDGVYTASSANSLAVNKSVSENGGGGGSETKTYVLQVQKSTIATLHGQITLSYTVSGQSHTLDSNSDNAVRGTIPAGTQVTVTAIPAKGYQLTRLAYNYSYPSTASASVSPTNLTASTQGSGSDGSDLDYTKAIKTTFTMPAANVYVTAAFGEAVTVTGTGEPQDGTYTVYGTSESDVYGTYTISSEYNVGSAELDGSFPSDAKLSGTTGAKAAVLTAQVKVTPGTDFFVTA
jgi:hypothetical protein